MIAVRVFCQRTSLKVLISKGLMVKAKPPFPAGTSRSSSSTRLHSATRAKGRAVCSVTSVLVPPDS